MENMNFYEEHLSDDFDTLLNNINHNTTFDEINEIVDEMPITINGNILNPEKNTNFIQNTLKKARDFSILTLITVDIFIRFIITIALMAEIVFSFYSVIILNYVFFVSSFLSYTTSPLYKINNADAVFSLFQILAALPLITFYIFYILKSVISLGDFLQDIPNFIEKVFSNNWKKIKMIFFNYFASLTKSNYKIVINFDKHFNIIIKNYFKNYFIMVMVFLLEIILLYVDKAFIAIGIICYVLNTIQIIGLILPSYIYFFQTLVNKKCKEVKYVNNFIQKSKKFMKELKSDSGSDSEKLDSKQSEKIIDDEFISLNDSDDDFDENINDIFEYENPLQEIKIMLCDLILADKYFSLYSYSKSISFDRHDQLNKIVIMHVWFVINLILICYDIYQLVHDFSDYFLASIIIRFLFIPLFSFYNICILMAYKAKDPVLRSVIKISEILTYIIFTVTFFSSIFSDLFKTEYRLKKLEFSPPFNNITIVNENLINHPFCSLDLFGVSAFDAFGYSLGGYDIKRNVTIFENQMKTFFGENYSSHISNETYELDKYFLFLKYYDSNIDTHIFAFRGFYSRPEIAFEIELVIGFYVIPILEDIAPFYSFINDNWLSFYTDFLNSFGLRFFENRNLIVMYVRSIIDIYNKENLSEHENVLFTGINTGGVIAKIVGTLLHRKSISFLSFPISIDFIQHLFDFSDHYLGYITNIYNVDGLYSHPDSNYAVNIGIDIPIFEKKSFYCTAKICDLFKRKDDVYQSFCTMSELCGMGNKFNFYCENTIGKRDIDIIRNNLKDD